MHKKEFLAKIVMLGFHDRGHEVYTKNEIYLSYMRKNLIRIYIRHEPDKYKTYKETLDWVLEL